MKTTRPLRHLLWRQGGRGIAGLQLAFVISACFLWLVVSERVALAQDADVPTATEQADNADTDAGKGADLWKRYVLAGKWPQGAVHYKDAIIAECSRKKMPSAGKMAQLYYAYQICHYFPVIERAIASESEARRLAKWLLSNEEFTRTLLRMIRPADDSQRILEIVHALWRNSPKRLKRYGNLAIAIAVVWDDYGPRNDPVRRAFAFYTANADKMRIDLHKMPPDMLKYVVDSQRSLEERKWALKRFCSISDMGRIYTKPEYDIRAYLTGKERKLTTHAYTLQNILKYGGLCHDRAIFASEVGKATGTPCVYIAGGSSSGISHAWVGYLRKRGKTYVWNRDCGRIGAEEITFGFITEPQQGLRVPEYELELALSAVSLSETRRREAQMWLGVAQILGAAGANDKAVNAMALSLKRAVYDRSQWTVCAQLVIRGVLDSRQVTRMIRGFSEALKDHPVQAVQAFQHIYAALENESAEQKLQRLDRMAGRVRRNTAAVALVKLEKGRALEIMWRTRDAEKVYAAAAIAAVKCKPLALDLLDNAARIMLARKSAKAALALHQKAYYKSPRLGNSAYVIFATRFEVGLRLAKLQKLSGNEKSHDQTLKNLCSKYKRPAEERQALLERLQRRRYEEINRSSKPVRR